MWIHLIVFVLAILSMFLAVISFWKIMQLSQKLNNFLKKRKKKNPNESINKHEKSNKHDEDGMDDPLLFAEKYGINKEERKDLILFQKKKKKFNYWILIVIIGNIAQIFGSGLCLVNTDYIFFVEAFVGIGCFFAYINLIKYIASYSNYSSFYHTLNKALPTALNFFFSISIIFCAFLMFGIY